MSTDPNINDLLQDMINKGLACRVRLNGRQVFVGKAKDLTPAIVARLMWQTMLAYTIPLKVKADGKWITESRN